MLCCSIMHQSTKQSFTRLSISCKLHNLLLILIHIYIFLQQVLCSDSGTRCSGSIGSRGVGTGGVIGNIIVCTASIFTTFFILFIILSFNLFIYFLSFYALLPVFLNQFKASGMFVWYVKHFKKSLTMTDSSSVSTMFSSCIILDLTCLLRFFEYN